MLSVLSLFVSLSFQSESHCRPVDRLIPASTAETRIASTLKWITRPRTYGNYTFRKEVEYHVDCFEDQKDKNLGLMISSVSVQRMSWELGVRETPCDSNCKVQESSTKVGNIG